MKLYFSSPKLVFLTKKKSLLCPQKMLDCISSLACENGLHIEDDLHLRACVMLSFFNLISFILLLVSGIDRERESTYNRAR